MHMHDRAVTPIPKPALVAREAARRLPRVPLLLLCAAYVLPGLFGREPWRNADLTAFGQMLAMAQGRTSWWTPSLGGLPTDAALLPTWIGAASIWLADGALAPALAARLPFAALLSLTLLAVWYATFHLARTDAAQPLAFAFGGEALPADYARAMADGALLALLATLGLLQLGHETTPELVQLAALSALLWSLSCADRLPILARLGVILALPALAASDAPALACFIGLAAGALSWRSIVPGGRALLPWIAAGAVLSLLVAWPLNAWQWRIAPALDPLQALRLWVWFLWPAGALAALTLWRWRRYLGRAHVSVPLLSLLPGLVACLGMGGSDRALMLALPGVAILAAFALPTLQRGTAAAIDWFSVFFFTVSAAAVWMFYLAMHLGWPAKPAANVLRLLSGYRPPFSAPELLLGLCATLAWIWLVRWRTGRHRSALWRSLVLPASGVALSWLLLMTLWLPALDHARSYRSAIEQLARALPTGSCVSSPTAPQVLVAALEVYTGRQVDARPGPVDKARCDALLLVQPTPIRRDAPSAHWAELERVRRPTERQETLVLYQRVRNAD
jgi:4-amino-4-deoxy-L-arabinose transferase-like glycosyltransferase